MGTTLFHALHRFLAAVPEKGWNSMKMDFLATLSKVSANPAQDEAVFALNHAQVERDLIHHLGPSAGKQSAAIAQEFMIQDMKKGQVLAQLLEDNRMTPEAWEANYGSGDTPSQHRILTDFVQGLSKRLSLAFPERRFSELAEVFVSAVAPLEGPELTFAARRWERLLLQQHLPVSIEASTRQRL